MTQKVIEVFKDTLVPASLVGLLTKLAGLIFSGYMGGLVDHYPRLPLIRSIIAAEKVSSSSSLVCADILDPQSYKLYVVPHLIRTPALDRF